MTKVWTFLFSIFTTVPIAWYIVVRFTFGSDSETARRSEYGFLGHDRPTFLSPHDRSRQDVSGVPPLSTRGRYIVDASGARVKLFSVNWYGASDGGFVVGGLDVRHRNDIALTIKKMGFNSIRLPYADELVYRDPVVNSTLLSANKDLIGRTALDVFSEVVKAATDARLFVIINNHITRARWCCDANVCDGLWKNDHWGPLCGMYQTQESWMENWQAIMRPHVINSYVVGADLRNEVRGMTDRLLWNSWATAAQELTSRLHEMQPNWMMFVEGVSSANNIEGAKTRPVQLNIQNKLVYSVHIYGWSGWGSLMPFWRRSYASFAAEMRRNWAYLLEEETAPVWVAEFGAPRKPNKADLHYWRNLMTFLQEVDADIGYWAINPRKWDGNESETYSLLRDDWKTPILDYRMYDMMHLAMQ